MSDEDDNTEPPSVSDDQIKSSPGEQISEPSEVDVLCGRGGMSNHHPGNEWYRRLIRSNRPLYRACPKHTKLLVSKAIVQAVEQQGGRFLEREKKSGLWGTVSYKRAVDKTSQGLRERDREEDPERKGFDQDMNPNDVPDSFSGRLANPNLSDLAEVAIAHANRSWNVTENAMPQVGAKRPMMSNNGQIQRQQQNNKRQRTENGMDDGEEEDIAPLPPSLQVRQSSMFRLLKHSSLIPGTWNEQQPVAPTNTQSQPPGAIFPTKLKNLNLKKNKKSSLIEDERQPLAPTTTPNFNGAQAGMVPSFARTPSGMYPPVGLGPHFAGYALPGFASGISGYFTTNPFGQAMVVPMGGGHFMGQQQMGQQMGQQQQQMGQQQQQQQQQQMGQQQQQMGQQQIGQQQMGQLQMGVMGAYGNVPGMGPPSDSAPPQLTRLTTQVSDWLNNSFWPVSMQRPLEEEQHPEPSSEKGNKKMSRSLAVSTATAITKMIPPPVPGAREGKKQLSALKKQSIYNRNGNYHTESVNSHFPQITTVPPPAPTQPVQINTIPPINRTYRKPLKTSKKAVMPTVKETRSNHDDGFSTESDYRNPPSDVERSVSASLLALASTPSGLFKGLTSFFTGGDNNCVEPAPVDVVPRTVEKPITPPPVGFKRSKRSLLDDDEETAEEARLRAVPLN